MDTITQRRAITAAMIVTARNFSPPRTRGQEQVLLGTMEEIRQEATRSRQSDSGRPLPLAAHWSVIGTSNTAAELLQTISRQEIRRTT